MKKSVLILASLLMLVFSGNMFAQEEFEKGTNVAQITVGFPQLVGFGKAYRTTIPAVGLAYDRGIVDGLINDKASIGVGGYFGLAGAKTEYPGFGGTYGHKYTYILAGARGTFHYELLEDFDTYAGVLIGARVVTSSPYGPEPFGAAGADGSGLLSGVFIGGRYYFTDNFAAVAELGFGVAIINLGVSARF